MPKAFGSTYNNDTARMQANKAEQLAEPPFWFPFKNGMAHIVIIDPETDFEYASDAPGGAAGLSGGPFGAPHLQLDCLEADLAPVDRLGWLSPATDRDTRFAAANAAPVNRHSRA